MKRISITAQCFGIALVVFGFVGRAPVNVVAGETSKALAAPAERLQRPKVVRVYPPHGTAAVSPVTELRIRFDRPMSPTRAAIFSDQEFQAVGPLCYDEKAFEFVLPVRLQEGCVQQFRVNRDASQLLMFSEGFWTEDRIAAEPYSWSFSTAPDRESAPEGRPKVLAVSPQSDSTIPLLTFVTVQFDRPMNPNDYGLAVPKGPDGRRFKGRERPQLTQYVEYDRQTRCFTLPLTVPPDWAGPIQLTRFCSEDGVRAEPITLHYRASAQRFSESLQHRIRAAGESQELRQLLERIREANRSIASVFEQIRVEAGILAPTKAFVSHGAVLRMQRPNQFYVRVDEILGPPTRIGSDGAVCWHRGLGGLGTGLEGTVMFDAGGNLSEYRALDRLVECPVGSVAEREIVFCDPFGVNAADVNIVIESLMLEYMGMVDFFGCRCHRIRSWNMKPFTQRDRLSNLRDWYIDSQTLLTKCVDTDGVVRRVYEYSHVNQPIAVEEFRWDCDADRKSIAPEAYGEKFDRQRIRVNDGTDDDRPRVGWYRRTESGWIADDVSLEY